MFSYQSLEDRISQEHPLRPMRAVVIGWFFTFTAAAYNLVRLRNLAVAT